jgi:hypothetical protein
MRRSSIALAIATGLLLASMGPTGAAELTGGCRLEIVAWKPDGVSVLDAGVAPGAEGTESDPLDVAWDGRVAFRFLPGRTPFRDHRWAIHAAGIPVPILEGSDDDPFDAEQRGEVVVGGNLSDAARIAGLVNVTGWIEGDDGEARCDGEGWVRVVGDPVGTVPWIIFVALLVLALLFLLATPYTPDWDARMVRRKEHHPIRGIVGGLLLALGLGSIVYSFNELGVVTPWALVAVGIVIGVAVVFVPSRKALRTRGEPSGPTETLDPG